MTKKMAERTNRPMSTLIKVGLGFMRMADKANAGEGGAVTGK
jgi:hypothetical protein